MRTIAVDDEPLALGGLLRRLRRQPDIESVEGFDLPSRAIEWCRSHPVDVAFLDVEMPEMNGLLLAQRLRELSPDIAVVFVTAYSEYLTEALKFPSTAYLFKPTSDGEITDALASLHLGNGGR